MVVESETFDNALLETDFGSEAVLKLEEEVLAFNLICPITNEGCQINNVEGCGGGGFV